MGEFEKTIIKQANSRKQALPEKVANAPFLTDEGLQFYWDSFTMLSSDRNQEGPIPWSSMRQWALDMDMQEQSEREDFYCIMREMDMAYLEHLSKKRKAASLAKQPGGGAKPKFRK